MLVGPADQAKDNQLLPFTLAFYATTSMHTRALHVLNYRVVLVKKITNAIIQMQKLSGSRIGWRHPRFTAHRKSNCSHPLDLADQWLALIYRSNSKLVHYIVYKYRYIELVGLPW